MKDKSLRVLMIDDSEDDVLLIIHELKRGGYDPVYERAETAASMKKVLKGRLWDIILCDYKMPDFSAPAAIDLLKKANIDIPVIIVSGTIGEETAVECMRLGARDYIMKGNYSRLCPAIARELEDTEVRNKEKQTESEREAALELLRKSEKYYKEITENSSDIIIITDKNGDIKYCSLSIERYTGYKPEELIGKSTLMIIHPDDKKRAAVDYGRAIRTADSAIPNAFRIVCKDGSERCFEGLGKNLLDNPDVAGFIMNIRDITERRQAEEAFRKKEEMYRLVVDNMADVITVIDQNLRLTYVSPSVIRLRGYTAEEVMEQTIDQVMTPESLKVTVRDFEEELKYQASGAADPGRVRTVELEEYKKDGSTIWLENHLSSFRDKENKFQGMIILSHDITDRKKAEEALLKSEEKYRNILKNIRDGYFEVDLGGNMTFFNESMCRIYGYSKEELTGMNYRKYMDKENARKVFKAFNEIYKTGKTENIFEHEIIRKDGIKGQVEISVSLIKDSLDKPAGFRGISRDITDRKKAEIELRESVKKYRLLADNIDDVIFVLDINLNYTYASPSVKTLMGYEPEELLKLRFSETIAPSSFEMAAKRFSSIMEKENSGRRDVNNPLMIQLEMKRKDGSAVWTEHRASFIRDENQNQVGIISVSRDITERKQMDEKLHQTLESLRKAIGATIQVLVSALEARDPYTAGHQLRVADLARAIATEMGLPGDKIEGIRMAGSIHDIGKLSIPAEILVKPTKLTNIEFSLIKEHPQTGYEMLKNVESPWPLADIVHQHHERMNGSGYPGNLKGDEIIMEARIMAVADVVEAMASHRPYRPALGIGAALEEIEKNKGVSYDAAVVDACLKLFREKEYRLP